jgi:hypothetical protein
MKKQKEYSLKGLTSYKSAFSLLQGILKYYFIFLFTYNLHNLLL